MWRTTASSIVFAGNADCEVTDQTIDYVGAYAPMTSEDNHVFNMNYSKYA